MAQEQAPQLKGRFERWFEVEVVRADHGFPGSEAGVAAPVLRTARNLETWRRA